MENQTKNQWVFLPIHKTRIISEVVDETRKNKGYVLVDIGHYPLENENVHYSTIFGRNFKRTKETNTHIFISVPSDFKLNIRKSINRGDKWVVSSDILHDISTLDLKHLNKGVPEIETEETPY